MPRKNAITWTVGDGVTSARLNAFNSDLDDLYANGNDRLRLYQLTGDGLLVRIGAGRFRCGGTEGSYAGGTITVTNSTTTYIMIDSGGTIQTSTSGYNSAYTSLGRAVASGGTCTIIIDRVDAIGGTLGGLTFVDTRGSGTTPNDYNDFSFKAQFKNLTDIGLNGIATGTYARLIGGRGWSDPTGGYAFETAYTDDGIYHRNGSTTTWGSWTKNNLKNNLVFGTRIQLNGVPTASTLLSNGGFVSATATLANYTASTGAGNVDIQTSPDNSTWTTVASGRSDGYYQTNGLYPWTPSVSTFIPAGLYVRATGSSATNIVNVNICITPFA